MKIITPEWIAKKDGVLLYTNYLRWTNVEFSKNENILAFGPKAMGFVTQVSWQIMEHDLYYFG